MMLLFMVEDDCLCFYHEFRATNIDLGLEVYRSIQSLPIDGEYVIRGGASGDCTVRRVDYSISDGLCIVGDRVFTVMDNGDVDFDVQYNQDCVDDSSMNLESNCMCESIKLYAFGMWSDYDFGFLASVRGKPLRPSESVEYVQGYVAGKYRSTDNCEEIGWVVIDRKTQEQLREFRKMIRNNEAVDWSVEDANWEFMELSKTLEQILDIPENCGTVHSLCKGSV